MRERKPVLLIDNSNESRIALELLHQHNINFVKYHIKNFEESCCGDLPTIKAPSIFAPEGIFKGIEGVKEYITVEKKDPEQSESAFW